MVESMFKKGLVVGIIVLFIGLAFVPSINANINRTPLKNKLVETAVRIYNSRGITPYKLKLTEKESDEIDRIFDALKVSLDSAETGEEIDEIYDEAVESLYELGLFPKMTLKEAKQLVDGKGVKNSIGNLGMRGGNSNCRISGTADVCYMFNVGRLFMGGILFALILFYYRMKDGYLWNFPNFNGRIGTLSVGSYDVDYDEYSPSYGWVHTNGTNGVIKWEGAFYGDIDYTEIVWEYPHGLTFTTGLYKGVHEFNGIWTQNSKWGPSNFIGNAEHVKLSYTPSWP
jgi:hypothetical protein